MSVKFTEEIIMRFIKDMPLFLFLIFGNLALEPASAIGATCVTFVNQYNRIITECEDSNQDRVQQQQLKLKQQELDLQRQYYNQKLNLDAQRLKMEQQAIEAERFRQEKMLQEERMARCTSQLAQTYPTQQSLVRTMCKTRLGLP